MNNLIEEVKNAIKRCDAFTREYGVNIEIGIVDYSGDCGKPIYGVTITNE